MPCASYRITSLGATASVADALQAHWREYLMEAAELAVFMMCVCGAGTLLYAQHSPLDRFHFSRLAKSTLMGVATASGAYLIIRSPFGRRSGAHFNPALSLAYFWLGRMHRWDASGYIIAQFFGGLAGVFVSHQLFGTSLADLPVKYVVTLPGRYGTLVALLGEFALSFVLMEVILIVTNHRQLAKYSPLFVALVTISSYAFSPMISGYSANPARSFSSAMFAHLWRGVWIYFAAPSLGMLTAAAVYKKFVGSNRIYCAKVFHDLESICPFDCHFHQLQSSS